MPCRAFFKSKNKKRTLCDRSKIACGSVVGFFSNGTMVNLDFGKTFKPFAEMALNVPILNFSASGTSSLLACAADGNRAFACAKSFSSDLISSSTDAVLAEDVVAADDDDAAAADKCRIRS